MAIRAACKRSVLFYINVFGWTYDARKHLEACQPFITYDFEDELIRQVVKHIRDDKSMGVLKSRAMGVTCCITAVFDWLWRFHHEVSLRCLSSKEDRVDNRPDMGTIFAKFDYLDERLPYFLRAKMDRVYLRIYNQTTRSAIIGESTNQQVGRGARDAAVLRDEEATEENGFAINRSLQHVTLCQLRVSTPQGMGNSFQRAYQKGSIDFIELFWALHPEYRLGLYRVKDTGEIEVIDKAWHEAHPGYEFRRHNNNYDGKHEEWYGLRSPWYDTKCDEADSDIDIAQELDLSFIGSGSPFFSPEHLQKVKAINERKPFHEGKVRDFLPSWKSAVRDPAVLPARAWFHPLVSGKVPGNRTYTIAFDVAAGTGASYSAMSVGDDVTKTKIFEYVSNRISPEEFADLAVAFAAWFTTPQGAPYLIWDMGGPGGPFGERIVEKHKYRPVYYFISRAEKFAKRAKRPGYPSNHRIKYSLIERYRHALFHGGFITHSALAYTQAAEFVYDGSDRVTHTRNLHIEDRSDEGSQHGDVVTSEALLCLAMEERPLPMAPRAMIPVGSFAWRDREHDRRMALQEGEWIY